MFYGINQSGTSDINDVDKNVVELWIQGHIEATSIFNTRLDWMNSKVGKI